MRSSLSLVLGTVALSACYTGVRTEADINRAWQGRSQEQIESHWGAGTEVGETEGLAVVVWRHVRTFTGLPSVEADLTVEPGLIDGYAAIRRGHTRTNTTEVVAFVGPDAVIREVQGPSLRWGPPEDANIHWGFLLGFHAGMASLDDTKTPLPGGGMYIGGMLGRQLGLVGSFSLAAGKDDEGGAMGFAWALSPQYWIATRLWVRAGPAMILAFDPGFDNVGLEPGIAAGASYAVIKSGTFALDLRLDLNVGSETTFGNVGVGVNLN